MVFRVDKNLQNIYCSQNRPKLLHLFLKTKIPTRFSFYKSFLSAFSLKRRICVVTWIIDNNKEKKLFSIWDKMCRKKSHQIHVTFSPSLWLQSALLCHPGSLELVCSWTTPRCQSPQVISLAKSKCHFIFRQFFKWF